MAKVLELQLQHQSHISKEVGLTWKITAYAWSKSLKKKKRKEVHSFDALLSVYSCSTNTEDYVREDTLPRVPWCFSCFNRTETGWDLGHFAAVLQSLDLDTPLLQQQNSKKLHGPKNNCVPAQLGQILDPKDTKRPKSPPDIFEDPGAKTECQEQKQTPIHTTT